MFSRALEPSGTHGTVVPDVMCMLFKAVTHERSEKLGV